MKNYTLTILILVLSITAFGQRSYTPVLSREEQLNKEFCSGLFSQPDGNYFDLRNDDMAISANSYFNVLDWLQGRVAGLQIYNVQNTRIPVIRNSPAAIFVDEMRVDAGFLNMLPVTDIAMIKVMKGPSLLSWGAAGGAIAIYTKDGEDEEGETE
jgi:hypothetical protein